MPIGQIIFGYLYKVFHNNCYIIYIADFIIVLFAALLIYKLVVKNLNEDNN